MGRPKVTEIERWLIASGPKFVGILQDLAATNCFTCPNEYQKLAKRAEMALESNPLGGPPPMDWREEKLV